MPFIGWVLTHHERHTCPVFAAEPLRHHRSSACTPTAAPILLNTQRNYCARPALAGNEALGEAEDQCVLTAGIGDGCDGKVDGGLAAGRDFEVG
jgi:hypothetical protein